MIGEVQIAIYMDVHEANIAKGLLEANDVPCMLVRDDAGTMYPQLNQGLGIRLVVPEEVAERARRILDEAQADVEKEGTDRQQ